MAEVRAVGRVHTAQRLAQVDAEVVRLIGEPRVLTSRRETDVGLGQRAKFNGAVELRLLALRARVDLESGSLASVQIACVQLERHAGPRHVPAQFVSGVGRPLA